MESEGRIRISLTTGELEIEGSSEFVKAYDESIAEMLERLVNQPAPRPTAGGPATEPGDGSEAVEDSTDENKPPVAARSDLALGEALHKLPRGATGTDKILVAALYSQKDSAANEFTTASANKLLIDQGVKLSNAAQAVKGSVEAKRVFKVHGNKWRISQTGMEYLASFGLA